MARSGPSDSHRYTPNTEQFANDFVDFFKGKIRKVRDKFDNLPRIPAIASKSSLSPTATFSKFTEVTDDIIRHIIMKSPSTCSLDSIPTRLLKDCLDVLLPSITRIVNLSLLSGEFPSSYKISLVTPLIKKLGPRSKHPE